ncbi:hypothetical protein [Arthrobacter sp. N1]
MRGVEDGTPGAADALIGDLRAPVDGPVPAGSGRPGHDAVRSSPSPGSWP